MDINERVDRVELTLVDLLQKSDLVDEYIREILRLTTSIENKTDLGVQTMLKLVEEDIYQPDILVKINELVKQFVDIAQNQQHLFALLHTRLDKDV